MSSRPLKSVTILPDLSTQSARSFSAISGVEVHDKMSALQQLLTEYVVRCSIAHTSPAFHDILAIVKGARNGLVYGIKIRQSNSSFASLPLSQRINAED